MIEEIRGCCTRVWEQLGPGYSEVVYQKALNYELNTKGFITDVERYVNVIYEDSKGFKHIVSSNRIDIFIHGKDNVILELKNINKKIGEFEFQQVKRYFKELDKEKINVGCGIVINFPQVKTEVSKNIEFEVINNTLRRTAELNGP